MVGVFSALDGMLFYVFFEATLIPMYSSSASGAPARAFTRPSSSRRVRCHSCSLLSCLYLSADLDD